MANIAIIPIGGLGLRLESDVPKQFLKVNGQSVYLYTLDKFQNNENVDKIVLACLTEYKKIVEEECMKCGIDKLVSIVDGGRTQLESIFNCLNFMKNDLCDDDKIIIHVGNRPNVSDKLITTAIRSYDLLGALTTVVPEVEVMVNKVTKEVVERDNVMRVQTPQVYSVLDLKFFIEEGLNFVNDYSTLCDLFLRMNKNISFIDGEMLNFKITYPEDLELFRKIVGRECVKVKK